MTEDYDGTTPLERSLLGLMMWVQIHGNSKLYTKVEIIDDLARRVGKVKKVQIGCETGGNKTAGRTEKTCSSM